MLKMTSVILFVVMCSIVPLQAQSVPDVPVVKETRAVTQNDLRQVFSNETQKLKSDSTSVDAKSMERLRLKQAKRGGWNKKTVTFMVVFAIALTVLVVLLVKYGKECLRYYNDCSPSEDGCYCEEYAPEEPERRRR